MTYEPLTTFSHIIIAVFYYKVYEPIRPPGLQWQKLKSQQG